MKKIIGVAMLFISLAVTAQSNQRNFNDLIGSWRNKNGFGIDVLDSATIYLVRGGNHKLAALLNADFSSNPLWLDLSLKESGKVTNLKSLLVFITDDTVQWQLYDTEAKPAGLRSDNRNTLFLRRVRQLMN